MTAKTLLGAMALIILSGAFVFVYDYFTSSRLFMAHRIDVTGHQRLTRAQVLAIAQVEPQANILSVNLTTTRKRLLADPWIAAATVRRQIPSSLHIKIHEEVPLARLKMDAGQGFLINVAGRVFTRDDGSAGGDLPWVDGLNHGDLPVLGQPASQAFSAVMTLLGLASQADNPLALAGIRGIWVDREIGATVYIGQDDRAVKLGFGSYREKCAALGRLIFRLRTDSRLARYRCIDLFDVNRVVVTLAPVDPPVADPKEV